MKIEQAVIDILEQCRLDGERLYLPDCQLDRKLYMAVDKVLKLAGGKWNRSAKAHIFTEDIGDVIDNIVLTGEICDIQKELQYFPTPPAVIGHLIRLADICGYDHVLEPSAGQGAIAKQLKGLGCSLTMCEVYPVFAALLSDLKLGEVVMGDFLAVKPSRANYDKIVANPPFTRQQDIDHVNHMIDCCCGRVVSVMSASVRFRDNKKTVAFRERIDELGGYFVDLPEGSFKASGTMVNACIIVVDV